MARQIVYQHIPFPKKGLDEGNAYYDQPKGTCREVQNMRPYDPVSGRLRGGQRGGLTKFTVSSAGAVCQDLNQVTSISTAAASTSSLAIRTVLGCLVVDGDIQSFTSAARTAATGGTNVLDPNAPVIFSAESQGILYFADGVNYTKWTASTNTASAWTASSGTLPASGAEKPRLIELWRGRIVLAGIKTDPHNWFMAEKDDPTNFNYAPDPTTELQAVAGSNSPAGLIAEPIMGIIPYSEDLLIFGSDHSMWALNGDPMAGGRIVQISGITGLAWGRAWCKAPGGVVYFFGSRGGVYRMTSGSGLERITARRLDERLANIDLNNYIVRMAWNDREIGVHVFITPLALQIAEHYFYDVRTDSWWKDKFNNVQHSPVAVHVFDGDMIDDRRILIGGKDGWIRYWTTDGLTDDGTAIESNVLLGPIMARDESGVQLPFILSELQITLAENSDTISYEVHAGDSAEEVFSSANQSSGFVLTETDGKIVLEDGTGFVTLEGELVDADGTWSPITSDAVQPRLRGYAAYVRLKHTADNSRWAMEELQAKLAVITTSKRRIF